MSRLIETESLITEPVITQKNEKKSLSDCNPKVALITFALIASSTLSVTSFKMQGYHYKFKHGVFQVLLMFIGEWFNILIFGVTMMSSKKMRNDNLEKLKKETLEKNQSMRFTKLWMAIPSFLDTCASALSLISLLLMPASIGGKLLFITVISRIMLKKLILRHHILACFFSVIGFAFVGYSGMLGATEGSSYSTEDIVLGITLTIFYMILSSLQSNIEELILNKKAINVQRMIGLEGIYGLIWSFVLCVGASYITCPNSSMCEAGGYFDDLIGALTEIFNETGLFIYCSLAALAVLGLNLFGLMLIKEVSAVFRAFWGSMGIFSVWAVNLLLGLETLILMPAIYQFIGCLFLLLGTFTYIEIIEWKFFGLNKELKKYQGENKVLENMEEDTTNEIEKNVKSSEGKNIVA